MAQAAKPATYKKQVRDQNPLYLVRRISHGLAGWLTFIDVGWRHTVLSEYYLYPPIFEMALGRKWLIRPQRPIERTNGQIGASKTVDFVMFKKPRNVKRTVLGKTRSETLQAGFVAVELKFPKKKILFPSTYVEDCQKMGSLTPSSISLAGYKMFPCCFMIAGEKRNVVYLASKDVKDKSRQQLIEQLKRIFKQEAGKVSADGWYCDAAESLPYGSYRVVVMLRQKWWKQLEVKLPETASSAPET